MRLSRIGRRLLRSLKDFPNNPRNHTKRQLRKLAGIIGEVGFIGVIVIDENDFILAGHARRQAALMAGIDEADCLVVDHLTEAQKRAFVLADNKMGLDSTWDTEKVDLIVSEILELDADFDISITGFDASELDQLTAELNPEDMGPSIRDEHLPDLEEKAVATRGDLIALGEHRLMCADSRDGEPYAALLGDERAIMVISDAPYNLKINGHVGGSGNIKQREFIMGSGEMSDAQFTDFLSAVIRRVVAYSCDGSMHFQFMDFRHMRNILDAGEAHYSELKNLIVWDKGVGGMGTFYRSRHELIFAFKNGAAPHINNFGLGDKGRYRTNVWSYRGLNTGGVNRQEELSIHPTAKPVQMLADAMLDCSRRGSIVLDPFGGSGSTLIAADKTGRRARLIELDPLYVDCIIRRWQKFAKDDAVFLDTGETFDEREKRLYERISTVWPGRTATSRIVDFSQEVRP